MNTSLHQLYLSTDLEDLTQLWTFVPTWRDTPVACGTFHIRNELAHASVDLYYSLRADNTPVTVYQHHGGTNQMVGLFRLLGPSYTDCRRTVEVDNQSPDILLLDTKLGFEHLPLYLQRFYFPSAGGWPLKSD